MSRRVLVWLHRWVGLAITIPLIVVGATGSLLAFLPEINATLNPKLYPPPRNEPLLPLATLAEIGARAIHGGHVDSVYLGDLGTASLWVQPSSELVCGKPATLPFNELLLDPYTGAERGRINNGLPTGRDNLMSFIYDLHYALALGSVGYWVLGIAALLWTLDSVVSLSLTFPVAPRGPAGLSPDGGASRRWAGWTWWRRWGDAWLLRWFSPTFRRYFTMHRAWGLWVWIPLLVYAWSSVFMNLHDAVYAPVTRLFLDYPATPWEAPALAKPLDNPAIDWRQAESLARGYLDEQARTLGFSVVHPVALSIDREHGLYVFVVRSTLDIKDRKGNTAVAIDANSGALRSVRLPTGYHSGTTVTSWLNAFHDANVGILGFPYRVFVSIFGVGLVMLSVTGVYIWFVKWRSRRRSARRHQAQAGAQE